MKKRKLLYLFPLAALILSGCDFSAEKLMFWKKNNQPEEQQKEGEGDEQQQKKDFVGLSFSSSIVTYDGAAHKIEVEGELPAGASVSYGQLGNSFTDVGVYEIHATVSAEGYNDLSLTATLTIKAADFVGLSMSDATVTYDGSAHKLEVAGDLPVGATVTYADPGNTFTNAGVYEIHATVHATGYNDLSLQATLTINKADMVGIVFENQIVSYDGNAHSLEAVIPEAYEGATVVYSTNSYTDVGSYPVTVTISLENYNDYHDEATLTIAEAVFEGLSFTSRETKYNGEKQTIELVGELPEGAVFAYVEGFDGGTIPGTYTVNATVTLEGYHTLELSATLTIVNADFEGIEFEDVEVAYDTQSHSIEPVIPAAYANAEVSYGENGHEFTDIGEYDITCTISMQYYNDYEGEAHLSIIPGPAAENLMVSDFEGLTDNDLADDYELLWYGSSGWQVPSSAKMSVAHNQLIGNGSDTIKLSLTHQGSPFKVTKELGNDKTYRKYTGFAVDTFVDDHVEGGTTTLMVQFWFKDLPLPVEYQGFANTYATYTLSADAQKGWAHWEVPFSDDSLRIAGNDTITAAFKQMGYNVADFSVYIDAVAFLANPNYVDGKNAVVYYDNLEMLAEAPETRSEERYLEGGRYGFASQDHYYVLDLADNLETATYSVDGTAVSALTVEKTPLGLVFKDTQAAGAGLTVNANIVHGGIEVESVSGQVASQFSYLVDMRLERHANLNLDFAGLTAPSDYSGTDWKQEYYGSSWVTTSGQMRVRGDSTDPHLNCYTTSGATYRYTYTSDQLRGLANTFSIDVANYFSGSKDINYKIKLVNRNSKDKWLVGDADNFEVLPADTAKWLHISKQFEADEFTAIVIVLRGTSSGGQYFYFDNVKLEYALPEEAPVDPPVQTYALSDGTYYIWNAANDAFRIDVSGTQTAATVTKYGSTDSFAMSVAVNGNEVTIADTTAAGQGLTIVGTLTADNELKVTSVTGAMGSAFSGSLLNKTAKKCADVSLDFADGGSGEFYAGQYWLESDYTSSGWSTYAAPTNMRNKTDKNGNKVVNMHCGTGAKNFRYAPDIPIGPVNHLEVDLGNYWSSSAGTLRYKISLLDENDQVKKYVAGDGSTWATLAKDTSQGNLCVKQEFDFDLTFAKRIRITTSMASGEAYLYMDNLKVSYKAPEPAPVAVRRQYIETKSWFNNNLEGEKVCVYAFKAGSNPVVQNAAFPGEEATWVKDIDDGKKIFYFDIPETYDTFVVVRVVGSENSYQTVDISIASLGDDNCIYLDADAGSNAIAIGHYTYVVD